MFRDGKGIFAGRGFFWKTRWANATATIRRFYKTGRRKWIRRLGREVVHEQEGVR